MAAKPQPAPWNTDVTTHRRWRRTTLALNDIHQVKTATGVSFNDVIVAGCAAGLRRFLIEHGEAVEGRTLKAMVPVSRRGADEHGETLGNRVSMFVVELPMDESDLGHLLHRVHAQTAKLKDSGLVDGAEAVIRLADAVSPLAAPLTRFVSRNIPMNLVITNIPGPPVPLWLFGAPLREVYPYVEVVDNEGLTIAVLSYCDTMYVGITSDRDVVPDLGLLADHIRDAVDDLVAHADR